MKRWMTWFFAMGLFGVCQVLADAELERSNLVGLVKEIDFMLIRVDEMKIDAPDQGRLRFQYDDLKCDLVLMREGISDYIEADIRLGRDITPIKGSYR